MKIAVYGCSWSSGIYRDWSLEQSTPEQKTRIPNEDFVSWPSELSKLYPNFEVTNYALPGASSLFTVNTIEKTAHIDYDIRILQVTTPHRFVSWDEDLNLHNCLVNESANLKRFDESILKKTVIYDSHFKHKKSITSKAINLLKEANFIQYYYHRTTDEMFNLNHKALVCYAKSKVDLTFSHVNSPYCISVENTLGTEQFENYFVDKGKHFGIEGCQWQAKWVLDQINTI